jgi:hypothetical protein
LFGGQTPAIIQDVVAISECKTKREKGIAKKKLNIHTLRLPNPLPKLKKMFKLEFFVVVSQMCAAQPICYETTNKQAV